MKMNSDGIAALGLLFLLGVFIGMLLASTGQEIEFAIVSPKQGIGCKISSTVAIPT